MLTFIAKGEARDFGSGTWLVHDGERYVRGRVLCPDGELRKFSIVRDRPVGSTWLRLVVQKRLNPHHSVNVVGTIDLTEQPLRFVPDPNSKHAHVFG